MSYTQSEPPAKERLNYFVPRQLLLLVEHEGQLNRRQINDLIKWSNAAFDDADLAPPHRLLSFPRTKTRSAFSLIFTNVQQIGDEPADLLRLLERLQRYFDQSIGGVTLRSASPHWFGVRAPLHIGGGGPGARPIPADPLPATFHASSVSDAGTPFGFKLSSLPPMNGKARQGVEVAILDTAPCHHDLVRAYHRWKDENPLMRSLLQPGGKLQTHYATFADLVRMADYEIFDHRYQMADHGLFAAGIIHTVAPHADLRLIEVLNPQGVGDVESIALGLRQLVNRRSRVQLVVNMSLVVNIPSPDELRELQAQEPAWQWLDESNYERVGWPLEWICDVLHEAGVPLIAAAGNDAKDGHRPPARYPAAFRNVLGVGALLEGSATPTEFSNLADTPVEAGIMTFGGGVNKDIAVEDKGVLGVYTGSFPDGSENKSGWAWWAGTSFATPIIAGCIAAQMGQGTPANNAILALRSAEPGTTTAGEEVFTVHQG
jgi:hypothetical protein